MDLTHTFSSNNQILRRLGFSDRKVYVVTGMHRSGTSFVARALYEAGVDMGEGAFLGATEQNKLGYAENAEFVTLHSKILAKSGTTTWWEVPSDERIMNATSTSAEEFDELVSKWQRPFWGFKDPRFSLVGRELLPRLPSEDDVYLVCTFRKPHKVVQSAVSKRQVDEAAASWSVDEHNIRLLEMIADFVGLRIRVQKK